MERCLGDQNFETLLIYLDDIIIFSKDFDSHLQRLDLVFARLAQHGLKIQPSKCFLLQREVKYLGHVVSEKGIATDQEKCSAIKEWKTPSNIKELRSFLGLANYYRRFIKDFSKIAQPLYKLLQGSSTCKKGQKAKKVYKFEWNEQCTTAFDQLKECLSSTPILAYADFTKPFTVYTDASNDGLGAVLAQNQHGTERVIAYASRTLHKAERNDTNYSAFKLEPLAMK